MKVKCINNDRLPYGEKLTIGKEYEVIEVINENHYRITNDNGISTGYKMSRFETVSLPLEEQLQEAKNKVSEIEAQIDAQRLKVGQKYKHKDGGIYMIFGLGGQFGLVCVDYGSDSYYFMGQSYAPALFNTTKEVFDGNDEYFTLL